jgi:hypothetical protein
MNKLLALWRQHNAIKIVKSQKLWRKSKYRSPDRNKEISEFDCGIAYR